MTELALQFSVQQLHEYHHSKFIRDLELNESNENNLKVLMKVTNYYRHIIPIHALALQSIRARSILVGEKYQYYKEDVKKLENVIDDVFDHFKCLNDKIEKVKEKQKDLASRAQYLVCSFKNYGNELTNAEIRTQQVLEKLTPKIDSFKSNMNSINSAFQSISEVNEDINIKKWYLKNWQLNLIRNNLFKINGQVQHLIKDIKLVKKVLD